MVIQEGLQTEEGSLEAATWPRVMRKMKVLRLDDSIMATLGFDMAFCGEKEYWRRLREKY